MFFPYSFWSYSYNGTSGTPPGGYFGQGGSACWPYNAYGGIPACHSGIGGSPPSIALIPIMTSDTSPYGIASASFENHPAYFAFDGDDTSYWQGNNVENQPWIQYQFSIPYLITSMTALFPPSNSASNYNFQASNDGLRWVTFQNITPPLSSTLQTYNFPSNTSYYSYYRWKFTNTTATEITVYSLQLYGH